MKIKMSSIYLSICAFVVTGCASSLTPIGEEKFDCNRKENAKSVYCLSFRGADDSTEGALPQSRYDKVVTMSSRDKLFGIAPDEVDSAKSKETSRTHNLSPTLPHQIITGDNSGMPVRAAPVIQKTWIKRFVDDNDTLTNTTTVYKEIRPTHWTGYDPAGGKTSLSNAAHFPHKAELNTTDSAENLRLRMDTKTGQSQFKQPATTSDTPTLAQPSASQEFDGSLPK